MSQTKLIVEVMDNTGAWQDITTDVQHIKVDPPLGFGQARNLTPGVGGAVITLKNTAKTYTPDVSVWQSSLLENNRRIRVKATGSSQGKCVRIQQTRNAAGIDQGGFRQLNIPVNYVTTDTFTLTYQARAAFDSMFNSDRCIMENGGTMSISQANTYTNKWQTITMTGNPVATGTIFTLRFDVTFPYLAGTQKNSKYIEYKNVVVRQNGGANLVANGDFSNGFTSWVTYGASPAFATVTDDYWIIFNGFIHNIQAAPFANAGDFLTDVICVDFVSLLQQKVDLPLQKNQTGDQLNSLALTPLSSYKTLINLDKPLVYYRMDATSGTTELDASGNSQSGTYSGAVGYSAAGIITGDTDTAITFDGSTTKLTGPTLNLSGSSITLEAWFNSTSIATTQCIMEVRFADVAGQAFKLNVVSSVLKVNDGSGGAFVGVTTLASNKDYHAMVTLDSSGNMNIYLNGILEASYVGTGLNVNGTILKVGNTNTTWFVGKIDEVVAYNRILTATDALRHYNAGVALYNLTRFPGVLQDAGLQNFQVAFDKYTNTDTPILQLITDTTDSEYGRVWVDRDGTFRWANRTYFARQIITSPELSVTDGMAFSMQPERNNSNVRNYVTVKYYPRLTGSGVPAVLGQITSPLAIPPVQAGGVPGTLPVTLTYKDPATSRACGGDTVLTPVASTDYTVNTASDGSGIDHTSDGKFVLANVVTSAAQMTMLLKNYSTDILYVTKLQCRGFVVSTYDPVTITQLDAQSVVQYQREDWNKDAPFSNDPNLATSIANYVLGRYKNPFVEVPLLSADYKAQLNSVDLLSLEIMDMISISDTQSNITNLKHLIVGISYDLTPEAGDYIGNITFALERLDQTQYWTLGDPTYGVLGVTTALYV